MIVRDEQGNLPKCLCLRRRAVRRDRGGRYGIDRPHAGDRPRVRGRVFDFVWVDDFAAARNAALARATGDYAFWLDADDVVDPPQRVKLQALLDGLRPGDAGRLCGPLLVRSGAERRWRADGGGPYPAVSGARGRALDVRGARADLAGVAAGERPGALDRHHGPAHRLHRPGTAGAQAPARLQDPRSRAGRAAR